MMINPIWNSLTGNIWSFWASAKSGRAEIWSVSRWLKTLYTTQASGGLAPGELCQTEKEQYHSDKSALKNFAVSFYEGRNIPTFWHSLYIDSEEIERNGRAISELL